MTTRYPPYNHRNRGIGIHMIPICVICFAALMFPERISSQIIVDSITRLPLGKASIFDRKGNMIGTASDDGEISGISTARYPLTIRVIGYEPTLVPNPASDTIRLKETVYSLPEYVVDSRRHQVLHMIGYLREYSTISTYYDTVFMFREKTIDFMIPTKRAKGYQGWTHQRVLASKSYFRFNNTESLDSVSRFVRHNFSWSDLVGIFSSRPVPVGLRSGGTAHDTVPGKFSPSSIWWKSGDFIFLENDILADKRNQTWAPELFRLFSIEVEFTRFQTSYVFSDPGGNTIFPYHINQMTFHIESKGRSERLHKIFNTSDQIYIQTYGEIYFTDKEYMKVSEARKWEKDPPLGDEIGINPPPEASPLSPEITSLKDRVNNFDTDKPRIDQDTDRFYHVMKKYSKRRRRKGGILSKIIK